MTTVLNATPPSPAPVHADAQEAALQRTIARLQQRFCPPLAPAAVAQAVREAAADLGDTAYLDRSIPLLAERLVREWLSRAALIA